MILFLAYQLLILQKAVFHMTYVYHRPNYYLTSFNNTLGNLLRSYCIDKVLGDFNINNLNGANTYLRNIFPNHTLLVNEPTHISGFLTDHVYVYNESPQKISPSKTEVLSIYFSDRDAVKFRLQLN